MTARTEGFDELALPDLERRQANAIRYGTVAEVDYAKARVKIKSGNITTAWLPWAAGRASGAKRRWDPPEVGEQVAVISPGGDMAQGLVLPGVYQDTAAAPSDSPDKDGVEYGDGTVIEYDRGSHTLLVDLGGASITAKRDMIKLTVAGVSLTVSDAGVAITGGTVTHDGINISKTHTHQGSPTAPPGPRSETGAPT
jgi:phage baseplate assembly protein V